MGTVLYTALHRLAVLHGLPALATGLPANGAKSDQGSVWYVVPNSDTSFWEKARLQSRPL